MKALEELTKSGADSLLGTVEAARQDASLRLDPRRRVLMGQFLTPPSVASLMAGMIECRKPVVRVLDPGAVVGLGTKVGRRIQVRFMEALCQGIGK